MIDFDKMTVAEHEQYKEMQRKAKAYDKSLEMLDDEMTLDKEIYLESNDPRASNRVMLYDGIKDAMIQIYEEETQ